MPLNAAQCRSHTPTPRPAPRTPILTLRSIMRVWFHFRQWGFLRYWGGILFVSAGVSGEGGKETRETPHPPPFNAKMRRFSRGATGLGQLARGDAKVLPCAGPVSVGCAGRALIGKARAVTTPCALHATETQEKFFGGETFNGSFRVFGKLLHAGAYRPRMHGVTRSDSQSSSR